MSHFSSSFPPQNNTPHHVHYAKMNTNDIPINGTSETKLLPQFPKNEILNLHKWEIKQKNPNKQNLDIPEHEISKPTITGNLISSKVTFFTDAIDHEVDDLLADLESGLAKVKNRLNRSEYTVALEVEPEVIDQSLLQNHVPFSQSSLGTLPDSLDQFVVRFNGLCELICNKVLINDLLGKGEINSEFLKNEINSVTLNQEEITNSHLIDVYSIFEKIIAFLFDVYPDNIFSVADQWKLVQTNTDSSFPTKKVNENLLFEGLNKINNETTLKLEVFKKEGISFQGHSLLIKKMGEDNFIFFDPDKGEYRGLSMSQIKDKINEQLLSGGTDIFLTRADTYLQRLRDLRILKVAKEII